MNFLLHDTMHNCGTSRRPVSVHLSHSLYCIQWLQISNVFLCQTAPSI